MEYISAREAAEQWGFDRPDDQLLLCKRTHQGRTDDCKCMAHPQGRREAHGQTKRQRAQAHSEE